MGNYLFLKRWIDSPVPNGKSEEYRVCNIIVLVAPLAVLLEPSLALFDHKSSHAQTKGYHLYDLVLGRCHHRERHASTSFTLARIKHRVITTDNFFIPCSHFVTCTTTKLHRNWLEFPAKKKETD